jgi:hypothetical protein
MKFQSWKRKDKIKRSLPLAGQILTLAQYLSRSWPTFPLELCRTSPGCIPPPHTALTLPCGPARQSLMCACLLSRSGSVVGPLGRNLLPRFPPFAAVVIELVQWRFPAPIARPSHVATTASHWRADRWACVPVSLSLVSPAVSLAGEPYSPGSSSYWNPTRV